MISQKYIYFVTNKYVGTEKMIISSVGVTTSGLHEEVDENPISTFFLFS